MAPSNSGISIQLQAACIVSLEQSQHRSQTFALIDAQAHVLAHTHKCRHTHRHMHMNTHTHTHTGTGIGASTHTRTHACTQEVERLLGDLFA